MRVLVVSAWEPWRRADGACLILHAHLRELAPRHEIQLLAAGAPAARTPVPVGMLPEQVRGTWYGSALPGPADAVARRLRRTAEPAHVAYVARRPLVADLRRTIHERRPDVVHLFGWGTAALQPLLDGVPAVHDAVDPWTANHRNRVVGPTSRVLDRSEVARIEAHEKRWYAGLAMVCLRTESDAAELADLVPGVRTAVVPNGVDAGPQPVPATGAVLGFLGAFDARSNVEAARELVTQVLPLVRESCPDARVLLIGRDPPDELRALAGPDVEVTGTVADVRPHLERVTVLVAPIRSGRGVRNKVLEAMAAARPVVGTPLAVEGIGLGPGVRAGSTARELAAAAVGLLPVAAPAGAANRERVLRDATWARSAAVLEQVWSCASTS